MSREIKFEFLYLGMPYSSENQNRPWIKKQYTLEQLCEKSLADLSDCHSYADLIAKRQFTGLRDVNGVEIYEGDIVEYAHSNKIKGARRSEVVFKRSGFTLSTNNSIVKDDYVLSICKVIGNIYEHPHLLDGSK